MNVWETAQGLPQNTVVSIAQTRDGYLWLGTPNGLARFDGRRFQVFDSLNTPAMASNRVNILCAESGGGLWVGLEGGGALHVAKGGVTALGVPSGLPGNNVRALAELRDGRICLGTEAGLAVWKDGIVRLPRGQKTATKKPVLGLTEARNTGLWMLEEGKLFRVDDAGGREWPAEGQSPQWAGLAASYANNIWAYGATVTRISADGLLGTAQDIGLAAGDTITALCERSNGEVWVGTRLGEMRRLLGGPGKAYRLFPAGVTRPIRCIFEDVERNLWIGTEGGGLVRLKLKQVLTYGLRDGLPGETITSLCPDNARGFWVGCHQDGIAHCASGTFTRFTADGALPRDMIVWSLLQARDGGLWIGTEGAGLLRWKDARLERFGPPEGNAETAIFALSEDEHGGVYFGGRDGGLYHWTPERLVHYGKEAGMDGKKLSSFAVTQAGLWVGSNEDGLYLFRDGKFSRFTRKDGLGSDFVRALYRDGNDVLWIGTTGGLTRYKDGTFLNFDTRHGMWDNTISQIVEDNLSNDSGGHYLWLGSNHGVFRVRKPAFEEFATGRSLSLQARAYGLAEGLECPECTGGFAPSGVLERVTPNLSMKNPRVWFSTLRGLISLDPNQVVGRLHGIVGDHVVFSKAILHLGPKGQRFDLGDVAAGGNGFGTGTAEGIDLLRGTPVRAWTGKDIPDQERSPNARFHPSSMPFIDGVFIPDGGIAENHAVQITSSGLTVELPETTSTSWGYLKTGLNVPPGEMFDPSDPGKLGPRYLWMSGNQGITFSLEAVRQATGQSVERFTAEVCNLYIGSSAFHVFVDGKLVARRSGLVRDFYSPLEQNFVPVDVALPRAAKYLTLVATDDKDAPGPSNPKPPTVIVEEVYAEGQKLQPKGGTPDLPRFVVAPGSRNLEVHFAALSLVAPEKVQYRYRLEPLESNWVEGGDRKIAQYSRLPPGEYRFQVIACNNDGVWNETGAALGLVMQPHLWEYWWFIPTVSVLASVGLASAVGLVLRGRQRRRIALLQQMHVFEQERSRIARDLHDDLGSSLTNIALLSELALDETPPEAEAKEHLDEIFESAQRIARSVDEIVWAINPRNDPVELSLAYICKSAQDYLQPAGIPCRLDLPEEFPPFFLTASARHNLFLTVREALNNVIKHAGAQDVNLSLRVAGSALTVVLADNGCGFEAARVKHAPGSHDGLGNMAKRMEMIGGHFELSSRPGGGTSIRLTIPLATEAKIPDGALPGVR